MLTNFTSTRLKQKSNKMSGKVSLEEQVATLQKQFGGIVKLVKGLKASVEALEIKGIPKEMDEVKEILEAQRVIDEIIVANADAIKRMDREMKEIKEKKQEQKAPLTLLKMKLVMVK